MKDPLKDLVKYPPVLPLKDPSYSIEGARKHSKMAENSLNWTVGVSQMIYGHFWNACLPPFYALVGSKMALFKAFWGLACGNMRLKWLRTTCLSTPSGLGRNFEKIVVQHFFTHRN